MGFSQFNCIVINPENVDHLIRLAGERITLALNLQITATEMLYISSLN